VPDDEDSEEDLTESLEKAIDEYPDTCAVLVRRHGVWVILSHLSPRFTLLKKLSVLTVLSVIAMSGAIPSGRRRLKQKGKHRDSL